MLLLVNVLLAVDTATEMTNILPAQNSAPTKRLAHGAILLKQNVFPPFQLKEKSFCGVPGPGQPNPCGHEPGLLCMNGWCEKTGS